MSWIYPRRWWNAVAYDIWLRPAWFANQFTKHFEAKQTCRRRMTQPGPWEYTLNTDHWETTTWGWVAHLVGSIQNRIKPGSGFTRWPWHWTPRTCSFCGGVHPEDAIRLLREGWEVEATSKSYKRYLQPPGYAKWCREMSGTIGIGPLPLPKFPPPVPPVKVYVAHFNADQCDRFNSELHAKQSA